MINRYKLFLILVIAYIVISIISTFMGAEFYFCLKPFICIGLAMLIFYFTVNRYSVKKYKSFVNQIVIMGIIVYMLLYFFSGIVFSFANNPLNMRGYSAIFNIIYYIPSSIAIELIRYRITNNIREDNKIRDIVILNIILSFYMSNVSLDSYSSISGFVLNFYSVLVPNFVIGCLMSYVCVNGSLYVSLIYILIPILFNMLSPIIPNPEWIIEVILKTGIPLIIYTLIEKSIVNEDSLKKKSGGLFYYIGLGVMVVLVLFSCGIFRFYPVAIASNSMNPSFYRGDIQVIDKKITKYNVGDVIQFYGINDTIFVHRVVSVRSEGGKFYYVTKGDNNLDVDLMEISEDRVIGKAVLTIKYLGYPTVWISEI